MNRSLCLLSINIKKFSYIHVLTFFILTFFVNLFNQKAYCSYQKPDGDIRVTDIKSEKGIISRVEIIRPIVDYSFSTNTNKDTIFLSMPFRISDPDSFLPEKVESLNIESIKLAENISGQSVIAINIKTSKFKFFDYTGVKPSRLIIDFWQEKLQEENQKEKETENNIEISENVKIEPIKVDELKAEDDKANGAIPRKLPEKTKREMPEKVFNKNKDKNSHNTDKKEIVEKKASDHNNVSTGNKSLRHKMMSVDEKLYIQFAPLKNDIRLPIDRPVQSEINSNEEDEKLYNLALNLYNKKKYALALKSIQLFFKEFEKSSVYEEIFFLRANVNYALAEKLKSKNYFDKAISYYKEALRRFPTSKYVPQTLMFIGVSYFNKNLLYEALGSFEVGADKYADNKYTLLMRLGAAEVYFKLKDYKSAVQKLSLLKQEFTDYKVSRDAAFRIGDIYFEKQDFAQAVDKYIEAIEVWPDDVELYPNALFNLAESYFWLGKYEDSLKMSKNFLKLFAKYIRRDESIYVFGSNALVRIAEILEIMGARSEVVRQIFLEAEFRFRGSYGAKIAAIRRISQDVLSAPENRLKHYYGQIDKIIESSRGENELIEFANVVKGESLYKRESYEDAINTWEGHIIKYPRTKYLLRIKAHIVKALKQLILKRLEDEEYHMALKIYYNNRAKYFTDENSFDMMFRLIDAYMNLALFEDAEVYLKRSLAAYKKKTALNTKKYQKGRDEKYSLEQSQKLSKFLINNEKRLKNEKIENEMSFVDKFNGDNLKYEKKEEKTFEIEDHEVEYIRSRIAKEKKNYSKALEIALSGLKRFPDQKNKFSKIIGEIYILQKKWKEAAQTYSMVQSNDSNSLLNLAYANEKLGKHEIAVDVYKQVLNKGNVKEDEIKTIKIKIADLLFQEKKYKAAENSYRDYIEKFPKDNKIFAAQYRLGEALHKQNKINDAIEEWKKILENPDSGVVGQLADESIKNILWKQKFRRQLR